jgi:hypothetical protein
MTSDDLIIRWNALKTTNGQSVHQEYDEVHPLRIFFGIDSKGNLEFIIRIKELPTRLPRSSQSINVQVHAQDNDQLILCFALLQPNQKAVFMQLFCDLAESSRNGTSNADAVNKVLLRYGKWHKLMESGNNGILSNSEIKGLLGELIYLEELLKLRLPHTAVTGWIGPEGADHDFSFIDCWYEIKAIDPSAYLVSISSIEQLDTKDNGELILVLLEPTSPHTAGAITLNSQIAGVRRMLYNDYGAELAYEEKLVSAGYIELSQYDDVYFVLRGKRRFLVNDDFPAIRRSLLSSCIANAQYQLGISGLSKWEIL